VNGGYDVLWAPVWDRIDEDFDEHLEEIRNFLRCPTVSASDDDMLAGAEYVAALIECAGGSAEIIPTAGHPAVLGQRSSQVGGDDLVVEERASSVRWQQHGCAIETSYRP
jgi:acetylornithine deacetylase/succinyl-diaminopimelate desuccinylase-like protein